MGTIAQKERTSQEQLVKLGGKDLQHHLYIDPEQFWEELGKRAREGIRITLEKTVQHEFKQFIGALEYKEKLNEKRCPEWLSLS